MTSQITKDFKMKSRLRALADGGSINPNMLGSGAAARAGGLLAGRGRQIDDAVDAATGAPAPAPQQVAQAPKKSGLRSMLGLADGGSYLDAGYNANRYQQSQLKDGGRVKGPGGRTDDKVGPVMLSDEEYVLPGDTADAIGRDKLDAIRLATHEFKDDRKESALRKRADGGDGWYDDMMPMDHLADGGNPWIVDSNGTVRTNSFGDAAAGPGYQQPRTLPATQGSTAVGPARTPPMGNRPPIDMGMAEVVEPAAATRAERLGRMAGKATSVGLRVGGGLAATAPLEGFGSYKADTGGVDTSAGGTLGYLAKGEFDKAGTSLSGGAGEALADSGRGIAKTADWVAGLVGAEPNLTGSYDKMITDKLGGYLSLRNPEEKSGVMGPPKSAAQPSPVVAATSALRSDQGPAQPVTPGSYQSRRLSEMGVPLDVQNSKPIVGADLRTAGTSQYQNLGTYGGDGNIYGKADDPSRPGRINNFVGVGAGASPSNEVGNTVQSPATAAITSALRGLGSGPSAPGGSNSGGGGRVSVIGGEDRYDKLAKELRGMYSAKGQGNLAKKLVELEQLRANEQGNIRSNETSRANAQLSADTSRSNAELGARTNMAEALGRMEQNRAFLSQQAQAAQLKALQDAQEYSDERQDKGAARTDKMIEAAFTTNVDGKDVVDRQSLAQFNEYLGSGKVMHNGRPYMGLSPQEQAAALPDVINAFRVNQSMNQGGGMVGGGRTSNSPSALRVRGAEIGDLVNGLGVGEYLGSKLMPGYDSNVVERAGDRKVRSVEKVAGDDLERRKAILRNLASGS